MKTKKRLGEILTEAGIISDRELGEALRMQKKWNEKLGLTMVKLGFFDEDFLTSLLSEQLGIEKLETDLINLDEKILAVFPMDIIYKNKVVPYEINNKSISIITSDPTDEKLFKEISSITNKEVKLKIASPHIIKNIIDKMIAEHNPSKIDFKQDSRFYISYKNSTSKISFKSGNEANFFRTDTATKEKFLALVSKFAGLKAGIKDQYVDKFKNLEKLMLDKKIVKKSEIDKALKEQNNGSVMMELYQDDFVQLIYFLLEKNIISESDYYKKIVGF